MKRPRGVPPEASGGAGGQWVLFRGDQMWHWDETGRLTEHTDGDLETRYDNHRRRAAIGRYATLPDGRSRRRHGVWEYGPPEGPLRRTSVFEYGVEVARTWHQHGLSRSGAIAHVETGYHPIAVEVGPWQVSDGTTIDLGRAFADAELLAHPAMAERELTADELAALADTSYDAPSLCAWIRIAGRVDIAVLARIPCRRERWQYYDDGFGYDFEGEPEELAGGTLAARLAAVRWGRPWAEVLDAAAAWLLERGRPYAALDFLDAALRLRGAAPDASAIRTQVLRALGRDATGMLSDAEVARWRALGASDPAVARAAARELAATAKPAPRARLLRAFADGARPDPDDAAKLAKALPKALRESLHDPAPLARGFQPDAMPYLDATAFVDHPDEALRVWPCATSLDLMYASGVMGRLAATAQLVRYRGLHFTDTYLFDGGAAALGGSRFIVNLEALGLYGTSLWDEDLAAILASPHLGKLRDLELGNPRDEQNYTLAGLAPIVHAVFAPQLERLGIARRYFEADVVPDVIAQLPVLTALDLEGARLGPGGAQALAALPHRFVSLDLERCELDAAAAVALAASPILGPCTALDLGGNPLGTDGLVAIARSPHLGNLVSLGLGGLDEASRPNAVFVAELARGVIAQSIQTLAFGLGSLGPRGAHALAAGQWPNLRRLELYGNMILDDGAIELLQSPMLATVGYLDLGNNDLTDVSGIALAESPYANALRHIELGGALLEDETRELLAERFGDRIQFEYPWARR